MAKAHQAPERFRKKYRYISPHAIERFREYLPDNNHIPKSQLIDIIDDRVEDAIRAGLGQDFVQGGNDDERFTIVELRGFDIFALVRDNEHKNQEHDEVVVTFLTPEAVETSKGSSWEPRTTLASKLKNVELPKLVKEETPPVKVIKRKKEPAAAHDYIVLCDGEQKLHGTKEAAAAMVADLLEQDSSANVEIFQKVVVKTRVKVEVEF